jgi:hypothetical protein
MEKAVTLSLSLFFTSFTQVEPKGGLARSIINAQIEGGCEERKKISVSSFLSGNQKGISF